MDEATLAETVPVNGGITLGFDSLIGSDAERLLPGSASADIEGIYDAGSYTVRVKASVSFSQHAPFARARARRLSIADEFRKLADQWIEDTIHISNINKAIKHPAYQQIIGMGKAQSSAIIPLLLTELEQKPDHWFWALREITKEDPAQSEDTFDGAVQAWLRWGKHYLNAGL